MSRLIMCCCIGVCLLITASILGAPRDNLTASDTARNGKSASDFLTPDGRFDLNAVRASGYQGPLDLKGVDVRVDPRGGAPTVSASSAHSPADDPDDQYWDNSISPDTLSGLNGSVSVLKVYDGKLLAGGNFTAVGGVPVNHIAAWDGSSWSSLGSGVNGGVLALTEYDGKLIAGGTFDSAGGVAASNIAAWDGSSWSSLGSGANGKVVALVVHQGDLIAGGNFTIAGADSARGIASWNGAVWSSLGCAPGSPLALTTYNNQLIAAGRFYSPGDDSVLEIAAWDGATWSPFPGNSWSPVSFWSYNYVAALTVYDNKLVDGSKGGFRLLMDPGTCYSRVNCWDGIRWSNILSVGGCGGELPVPSMDALTVYGDELVIGGAFDGVFDGPSNSIVSWDGRRYWPLGSGIGPNYFVGDSPGRVLAATVYQEKLVVGGNFTTAGGKVAINLAIWTGGSVPRYAGPVWHVSSGGSDFNGDGSAARPLRSLSIAIWLAHSGDTVLVGSGAYSAGSSDQLNLLKKDIVLVSQNGPDSTSIAGMVVIDQGESQGSVVRGFTCTGIECRSSRATIERNVISGRGAYFSGSQAHLINNTIAQCASSAGAAIRCDSSSITIENCIIALNGCPAIASDDSIPQISCTDVFGNTGGDWIGAIADQAALNGNMSVNPFFCSPALSDFHLADSSECSSLNNDCGQLVGALGVNCEGFGQRVWHTAITGDDVLGTGKSDAPFRSIQRALNVCNYHQDTIFVAPGTYYEHLDFRGKHVALRSLEGPIKTVISAAQSRGRVIDFCSGESSTSLVDGFTLTGGIAQKGGAIYIAEGSSPTITNNVITENTALAGDNMTDAYAQGGAIYCAEGGNPIITNNVICDNLAQAGGAIYIAKGSSPTITSNVITGNTALASDNMTYAYAQGGAIYYAESGNPIITNNVICDNLAQANEDAYGEAAGALGGGIYCENARLILSGNVIAHNQVQCYTTSGDRAGGGLYLRHAEAILNGNTIVHNEAQFYPDSSLFGYGGGICCDSSALIMSSCLIAYNNGGGLYLPYYSSDTLNISHTDLYGNECLVGNWESAPDCAGRNGNMCKDPHFCNPDSGDYHLYSTSPCAPANTGGTLIGALPVGCSATDVDESEENLPIAFALHQNYPNPFNPTTTIEYSVPHHSQVILEIFNILGQSIRTLVNDAQAAGKYSAVWNGLSDDGSQVSSGVYLYRIRAGEFIETKKMVLLK